MSNWLEITGISLQVVAGLVFILDHVAHKFASSIERWVGNILGILLGQGKRRWRIVSLFLLIALPTSIIAIFMLGTDEEITWTLVGGVLLLTVFGFEVYAVALALVGRRLNLRELGKKTVKQIGEQIGEQIRVLIEERKIVPSNIILSVISIVYLVVFSLLLPYVHTNNLIMNVLVIFLLMFTYLIIFPIFLFSVMYLCVEGFIHLFAISGKIRSTYYWIAILLMWITGGAFLLVNAVCK